MQAARTDEQRRVPGNAGRQSGLAFFLVTFSWRNKKKSLASQRRKTALATENNFSDKLKRSFPLRSSKQGGVSRQIPRLTGEKQRQLQSPPHPKTRVAPRVSRPR